MKTRQSLVSNSSSTSFILYGILVDPKELKLTDIKNGEVLVIGCDIGGDGRDIFKIKDSQQLHFIQDYPKEFKVFKEAKLLFGSNSEICQFDVEPNNKKKMTIVGGRATINRTDSTQSLVERYAPNYKDEVKKYSEECRKMAKQKSNELFEKYGVRVEV
jgi:hypothetical protein